MIKDKKMYFSRDSKDILKYTLHTQKSAPDLNRTKADQEEVSTKLHEVIKSFY